MATNAQGLTYKRWLAAARRTASKATRAAWKAGEDTAEWAASAAKKGARKVSKIVK